MHLMMKKQKLSRAHETDSKGVQLRKLKKRDRKSGQDKKFASASRFSIKSSFCQSWDLTAPCLLYGTAAVAAAAQQTVNRVNKTGKNTEIKKIVAREKSRSRLLPQTAVARDLCAIFGLRARVLHKLHKHNTNMCGKHSRKHAQADAGT